MRKTTLIALLLLGSSPAYAYDPPQGPVALTAGCGQPGFVDGAFSDAKFNDIRGLLLDEPRQLLYVADRGNAAIRVVDLGQANRVSTLVGRQGPGSQDGPVATAKIQAPTFMVWGKDPDIMYFSDAGSHQIKKLDLKTQQLSTVCGGSRAGFKDGTAEEAMLSQPQGLLLVRWGNDERLLIADQGNSAIRVLDPKTQRVWTLFRERWKSKIQFLFSDHGQRYVFFTVENKPGIFSLYQDKDTQFTFHMLSTYEGQTKPAPIQAREYFATDQPITAWAQDHNRVHMVFDLPKFKREQPPLWVLDILTPKEYAPLDYHVWLPMPVAEEWALLQQKEDRPIQQFRLLEECPAMVIDLTHQLLYLADQSSPRIIKIRLPQRSTLPKGREYPAAKLPGVKRILLYGSSLNYHVADRLPLEGRNEEEEDSLSKRIEYWLNLIAFSRGQSERFEVIYAGGAIFNSIPSVSYAFATIDKLLSHGVDLVMYDYCPWDIAYDALRYLENPMVDGELQQHGYDPEFLLTPLGKRKLHPYGDELYRYLVAHPEKTGKFVKIIGGAMVVDELYMLTVLRDKPTRDLFFKLASAELERYNKKVQAFNQAQGRKVKLVVNLIPVAANTSRNEILDPTRQGEEVVENFLAADMRSWCSQHGVGFQDTIDAFRILEPGHFPLYTIRDNVHYTRKGANLVAFLTAMQLMDTYFPLPPKDTHDAAKVLLRGAEGE